VDWRLSDFSIGIAIKMVYPSSAGWWDQKSPVIPSGSRRSLEIWLGPSFARNRSFTVTKYRFLIGCDLSCTCVCYHPDYRRRTQSSIPTSYMPPCYSDALTWPSRSHPLHLSDYDERIHTILYPDSDASKPSPLYPSTSTPPFTAKDPRIPADSPTSSFNL
jgi:hypothetical protein